MPTTKVLTALAVIAWIVAVALVLGDGADNHLSEAGWAGYLIGMAASTLTITARLQRRLPSALAAFELGRRTSPAATDRH